MGKRISCVGNLRQWGIAQHSYADSYSDFFCKAYVTDNSDPATNNWLPFLYPFLSGNTGNFTSIYFHTGAALCPAKKTFTSTLGFSYAMNQNIGCTIPRCRMTRASTTVIMGDSLDAYDNTPHFISACDWDTRLFYYNNAQINYPRHARGAMLVGSANGKGNLLFVDGHVQTSNALESYKNFHAYPSAEYSPSTFPWLP